MAPVLSARANALLPTNARLCCNRPARHGCPHSLAHGEQVLACEYYGEDLPVCWGCRSDLVYCRSSFRTPRCPPDRRLLECGAPAFRLFVSQEEVAYRPSATVDRPQVLSRGIRCRGDA